MAIEAKGKQHNKQIVQRKREKKIMEEIEKELHELREQLTPKGTRTTQT